MRLDTYEGGIHTNDDLHRKFANSFVYGSIHNDVYDPTPHCYRIAEIEADGMYVQRDRDNAILIQTKQFELINPRPMAGIYNFPSKHRPFMVRTIPSRQWRHGWCDENVIVKSITDIVFSPFEMSDYSFLEAFFNPHYPLLPQALATLEDGKLKHIAINPTISIIKTPTRYLFLKNFVPFLSWSNGLIFKVAPFNQLTIKDYKHYAQILKQL